MCVETGLSCISCNAFYAVENRKVYFSRPPELHQTAASDIKHYLRSKLGAKYNDAVRLLGPGYQVNKRRLLIENVDPGRKVVVDLGSGTERIDSSVITVDLFDYPEVDVVCDLQALPFRNDSVDAFITTSVLEHLENVPELIRKTFNCTRAGGLAIHSFPFLYPFHEAPYDFVRYTHMGAASLFKEWTVRRLFNAAGPVTTFNVLAVEFLSSLLSFGNGTIKEAIHLGLGALLSPLKYLDLLFINRPQFLAMSAILCVVAEKPERSLSQSS